MVAGSSGVIHRAATSRHHGKDAVLGRVDLPCPRSTSDSGRRTTPRGTSYKSRPRGDATMRYRMVVKAPENFEKFGPPPKEVMDAIGRLGEEAFKAGKMVSMG